jgi:hypothetical protein
MGPIGCPETSVQNYDSTLRNIPKERRSLRLVFYFALSYLRCSSGPGMQVSLRHISHIPQMFVQQIALLTLLMKCFWAGVMVHVN